MGAASLELLGPKVDRDGNRPAHQQVRERLLDHIHSGVWQVGDRIPAETAIAAALGVSRMTANKAILSLVSEGYLARDKGSGTYLAERPSRERATWCGVVVNEDPSGVAQDPYFGTLFFGLQQCGLKESHQYSLYRLSEDLPSQLGQDRVGHVVFVNPPEAAVDVVRDVARQSRVVLLGCSWATFGFDSVDSDNALGAALAVRHLADLGHRRLMFVGACPNDSNTQDRLRGFELMVKALGLGEAPVLMCRDATVVEPEVQARLIASLQGADRRTAVLVGGANLGMSVLGTALRLGWRVPEDLSIVAYDDPPFLRLATPPLTTVCQPLDAMVEQTHEWLSEQASQTGRPVRRRVLDPHLIVRNSTGPVPHDIGNLS